jgi:hypothetical protein
LTLEQESRSIQVFTLAKFAWGSTNYVEKKFQIFGLKTDQQVSFFHTFVLHHEQPYLPQSSISNAATPTAAKASTPSAV